MGGGARFLKGTGGKVGLNGGKCIFFKGLSRELFSKDNFTPFVTKLAPLESKKDLRKLKKL